MTREEAIERLEDTFGGWERWNPHNDSPASKLSEALDMAIAALREQEKLESNLKVLESKCWISVEERLPDENGWYLTHGPQRGHEVIYFDVDDQAWADLYDYDIEVTHWMPLLEPPEEGVGNA